MSSSKSIFQESAIYYERCLKNSGYKTELPKGNNQNEKNENARVFVQPTMQQVRKNQYGENIHQIN